MVSSTNINKTDDWKAPVFVVLQLSGGNDFMSTVIPYNDPNYFEFRNTVGIPKDEADKILAALEAAGATCEIK